MGGVMYPMGCMFLWNDKICFIEIHKLATEQGDDGYEIHWLSKDGKENGTLVGYEQLSTLWRFTVSNGRRFLL